MSASDYAIRVQGLSKRYRLGLDQSQGYYRYKSLRDSFSGIARRPFQTARELLKREPMTEQNSFWALNDVSFDVKRGEVVGIIGRNGAGKSTLLKILSRITKPTKGQIELHGRVGSLLEVGTGFHPELSGRENIYLNGAILGMTRREVSQQFNDIISFSEIESFLDTPVKHYSSGMYTRLAFSVAAHLQSEILIVDEVLAVGDIEFQKKCVGKMRDVAGNGRTVFFVTHNMTAVRQLCDRCIWLSDGRCRADGDVDRTLIEYLSVGGRSRFVPNSGPVEWTEAKQVGQTIEVSARFKSGVPLDVPGLGFVVSTADGMPIFGTNPMRCGIHALSVPSRNGTVSARVTSPLLVDGSYSLSIWFGNGRIDYVQFENCLTFEVAGMTKLKTGYAATDGPVSPICEWNFAEDQPIIERTFAE